MDSDQASMGLRDHCNTFFGRKFVHGDGSVTGSTVVMQHLSAAISGLTKKNPLSESFKDLMIVPIILTVKRRSDLTRALTLVTFSSVLTCMVFQNKVHLPHSHSHPKMLNAT